ncbi:hypothetical protein LOTGIDRAFT_230693 [Lottia gigantea]|uniref:Uncharacterized protein n=1 Tax=Lottia gigantea TaxID=225164 RepID=V4AVP4_LOTGI|nr:hypothetical protein LOTGIDRAFT_230693 [Lottia gigantea]ESP01418.1 hypothetical protein LOTGIDRAFT_230693 [Lottia gigantea]
MTSFSIPEPHNNPWISEDKSLTSIKNALILGERTGHIKKRYPDESSFEDSNNYTDQEILPSLKLITVQRDISRKRRELNEVNLEIQKRKQDRETQDITHLDRIENKIEKIKSLNNHLQSILRCKDDIVNRLQQPLVGDYIKIDAAYHRYASEVFPLLTPILGELNNNLDNIEWYKTTQFSQDRHKLESLLNVLSSSFAAMQSQYQALCQMRRSMNEMYGSSSTVGAVADS